MFCSPSTMPGDRGSRKHCRRPCAFGSPTQYCSAALPFHCPISSQVTFALWAIDFSLSQWFFSATHLAPPEQRDIQWVQSLAPGWWPVSLWLGRNFQRTSGMHADLRGTGQLPNLTSKLGQERPHICFHQRKGMFAVTGNSGAYLTPLLFTFFLVSSPALSLSCHKHWMARQGETCYCCSLDHLRRDKKSYWLRVATE